MNYKFLKLLFTNLNNLETMLERLDQVKDFPNDATANAHHKLAAQINILIAKSEEAIKQYLELHK